MVIPVITRLIVLKTAIVSFAKSVMTTIIRKENVVVVNRGRRDQEDHKVLLVQGDQGG